MSKRVIPAWVEGLWREWADFRKWDGIAGDLDLLNDAAQLALHMRTGGKGEGPVIRAMIALEAADHGDMMMVDGFFRSLTPPQQHAIVRHYVERIDWDELGTTAWRRGVEASEALRGYLIGVHKLKGDDRATAEAVRKARIRRIEYAQSA